MKAIRLHGPDDLRCDTIPEPEIGPEDVLIRVKSVGICGSDLTYVKVGGVGLPVTAPIGLGHELSGVVDRTGSGVQDLSPGMRVVVNPMGGGNAIGNGMIDGAFAPLLRVCNARLGDSIYRIPDHLDFETAALAEPLSVALHAVNRARVDDATKAVVFGVGPIGLGIVACLRQRGCRQIVAVDMSDQRLARAQTLGASVTVNPSRENVRDVLVDTHGHGQNFGQSCVNSDVFFEVTGAAQVITNVIDFARFQARLVIVAVHAAPVEVNFQLALAKEMDILMSMAYPDEFPAVIAMLAGGEINVTAMISHRFGFEDFFEAFATARDSVTSAKVLIDFSN
tara:strand:+ start:7311 stop:8324 length:1014 start_codon:yes stop_codon:yes gene_type:complete